jgi:molybdopterin-containing oxidoreductase family membrane subunit
MNGKNKIELDPQIRKRMNNLLGTFIAAVFYFVVVYHLTNIYFAKQTAFEQFILLSGDLFPMLFWGGFIMLGTIVPLLLLFVPSFQGNQSAGLIASILTVVGGLCFLYVFIIGGQAYPLDMFPGMEIKSTFFDGHIDHYVPSLPEILLSIGGFGVAFTLTLVAVRALPFIPKDDIASLQASGALHD